MFFFLRLGMEDGGSRMGFYEICPPKTKFLFNYGWGYMETVIGRLELKPTS